MSATPPVRCLLCSENYPPGTRTAVGGVVTCEYQYDQSCAAAAWHIAEVKRLREVLAWYAQAEPVDLYRTTEIEEYQSRAKTALG